MSDKRFYLFMLLIIIGVVSILLTMVLYDVPIEISFSKKDLPPFSVQGFQVGPMQPAALYELTGSYEIEREVDR